MKLTRLAIPRLDFIGRWLQPIRKPKSNMRHLAVVLSVIALAGCGSKDAPSGQVVATVDGVEITQSELNDELAGRKAPTAEGQKQLQTAVLNQIIARALLADAAREQGLDDTPEAAIAKRRAEQGALIQLLEKKFGASSPQVSAEEVSQFVGDNAELFANRRIYIVDQIIVPSPPPALIKALAGLDTIEQIKAELGKYNLATSTAVGSVDALTLPPPVAKQIAALPPSGVFVTPGQGAVRINHIRESQVSPISGADAARVAKEMLVQRRRGQQVQDAMGKILKDGQSKVHYNPAFQPPAAKGPSKPGA